LPFLLTSCFSSCHIKAMWLTEGQWELEPLLGPICRSYLFVLTWLSTSGFLPIKCLIYKITLTPVTPLLQCPDILMIQSMSTYLHLWVSQCWGQAHSRTTGSNMLPLALSSLELETPVPCTFTSITCLSVQVIGFA
jgi:hypothetical protein